MGHGPMFVRRNVYFEGDAFHRDNINRFFPAKTPLGRTIPATALMIAIGVAGFFAAKMDQHQVQRQVDIYAKNQRTMPEYATQTPTPRFKY